jgi:hypothetical protein
MPVYRVPPCNLLHAATPSNTFRNGGVREEGGGEAKDASPLG